MINESNTLSKYSPDLIELVTCQYRSIDLPESWEARKEADEKYFNSIHSTCFPFRDIWDEISSKRGCYVNRAKLVRVCSADDGWPMDLCEHFGRLAMSISARAEILQRSTDQLAIKVERDRELFLVESFYGCLPSADKWPQCIVIACDYLLETLQLDEPGLVYSDDFD